MLSTSQQLVLDLCCSKTLIRQLVGMPSAALIQNIDTQLTAEKKTLAQTGAASAIYLGSLALCRNEISREMLSANPYLIACAGIYLYGGKTIARYGINSMKNLVRLRRQKSEFRTDGQLK